jgi:hypothetical protein
MRTEHSQRTEGLAERTAHDYSYTHTSNAPYAVVVLLRGRLLLALSQSHIRGAAVLAGTKAIPTRGVQTGESGSNCHLDPVTMETLRKGYLLLYKQN